MHFDLMCLILLVLFLGLFREKEGMQTSTLVFLVSFVFHVSAQYRCHHSFTLITADAPKVLLQTLNPVHLVTFRLFCQPSKHRGSTSKCEKYVAALNY